MMLEGEIYLFDQFCKIYFEECVELFDVFQVNFELFVVGVGSDEMFYVIFCVVYFIKGGVGVFGFMFLVVFFYVFESLFDVMCEQKVDVMLEVIQLLFCVSDVLVDIVNVVCLDQVLFLDFVFDIFIGMEEVLYGVVLVVVFVVSCVDFVFGDVVNGECLYRIVFLLYIEMF